MHELKRDYTLVIVTHNMQQAARVADMTAFFSLEVPKGPGTGSSSSTTRPRRSSPTPPTSGRRTTSPDGSADARAFHEELAELEARSRRRATSSSARCAPAERTGAQDVELADEVIALRRRDRRALPRDRGGHPEPARTTDAGRGRPASRARDPPRQPPPRADGRPLRDDREAGQARRRVAGEPALLEAFNEMGMRAEEMIRVASTPSQRATSRAPRRSSTSTS